MKIFKKLFKKTGVGREPTGRELVKAEQHIREYLIDLYGLNQSLFTVKPELTGIGFLDRDGEIRWVLDIGYLSVRSLLWTGWNESTRKVTNLDIKDDISIKQRLDFNKYMKGR